MGSIEETTWHIGFTNHGVEPHWVHFFISRKFTHCYCYRDFSDQTPAVYVVEPTTTYIRPEILGNITAEQVTQLIKNTPTTTILKFTSPLDFENKLFTIWNMAPTCVTVVKMFLGITAKAQTPYQLYKHLLKLGATQI